ncbi:ALG3-domain-containing protein [Meredithblackwellia eburnea MCA 4105]
MDSESTLQKHNKSQSKTISSTTKLSPLDPVHSLIALLTQHAHSTTLASLLLFGECILSLLIIRFVPYTEIDWSTYMQQVSLFLNGERDYSLIKGDTGPIVYPAAHLYLYSALYYLTNEGKNIRVAQYIFAGIYIVTQGIVFTLYKRCRSLPPYTLILLTLSKRVHSIYMLRMFNDGFAMMFFYLAVLLWTGKKPRWVAGSMVFSLALGIKMNFLLYLPGLLVLLFLHVGILPSIPSLISIISVQLLLSFPFYSSTAPHLLPTYFQTSFNFSRAFLWEWTVNWRWIGEEGFESKGFSSMLLILHGLGLVVAGTKWCEEEGGVWSVLLRGVRDPMRGAARLLPNPDHIATILFTSNLIGILFARSLHYQFYSWYFHQLVFLSFHTPFDILQRLAILATIEYSWNVFPSTLNSSMALTFANAFLVVGVLYGSPTGIWTRGPKRGGEAQKEKVQ